jgi:general secretion pathway protein G
MRTLSENRRRRGGFTLIEVLLVLTILVIIGGLAVGIYIPYQEQANRDAAQTQIGLFKTPLAGYQMAIGSYPTTQQGLSALCICPADLANPTKWKGPYFEEIPLDPWGNDYRYELSWDQNNRQTYRIWSMGPDGIDGTEDDIDNLTQQE